MPLAGPDREALFLFCIAEAIDGMVNRLLVSPSDTREVTFWFKSSQSRDLFAILLSDLLSASDPRVTGEQTPFLRALSEICDSPILGAPKDIGLLADACGALRQWLENKAEIPIWISRIQWDGTLLIRRLDYLHFCGNAAKHSPARLSESAKKIAQALKNSGAAITYLEVLEDVDVFREKLIEDVFVYHGTRLCFMLNNVRLGLYKYLRPVELDHQAQVTIGNDKLFTIRPHKDIQNEFAKHCFHSLMHRVGRNPIYGPFRPDPYLMNRY